MGTQEVAHKLEVIVISLSHCVLVDVIDSCRREKGTGSQLEVVDVTTRLPRLLYSEAATTPKCLLSSFKTEWMQPG